MAIQVKEGKSIQHPGEDNRMGRWRHSDRFSVAAIIEAHSTLRYVNPSDFTLLPLYKPHYQQTNWKTCKRRVGHFHRKVGRLTFTSAEDFPKLPKWDEKLHGGQICVTNPNAR